jgi:hypothetical protein
LAVAVFLLVVGVSAFAQYSIDRRTMSEAGEYYVVFHAYGPGAILPDGDRSKAGHAFVQFISSPPNANQTSFELRGMNRAELWYDPTDWGSVRSESVVLLGLSQLSLSVRVNSHVFNAASRVSQNSWYFLAVNDCVSYGAKVAAAIGLNTGARYTSDLNTWYPMDFLQRLISSN